MQEKKTEPKFYHFTQLQFFSIMIAAVVVWALAFPLIKLGLRDLSFVNLTIMRFLIVCITFSFLIIFKRKWFSKLQKKDIPYIFVLGFSGVTVYHLGLNYGEQYISAGAAILIIATIPIFIVIFATIFLKEKITPLKAFGIIVALIGVIIISIWGKQETIEIERTYAALAVLVSALMGAFYTISGKKLLSRYNGLSLTAYAMFFGSICLIPLVSSSLISEVSQMQPITWFAIIFLGIFSTVLGYAIWYMALEIKNASDISIYLYAIPVISTIVSFILFKDEITIFFLFGGAFVILGLYLVNKKNKKIQ